MLKVALVLGTVAALDVMLAPVLAYVGLLAPLRAFGLWLASALPGLVAVVLGGVALAKGAPAPRAAVAIAFGLSGVVVLGLLVVRANGVPRINDVSTDLDDPPPFVHAGELPANAGRDLAYPESFKEPVRRAYGDVATPVVRDEPPAALFARALAAAREMPDWEVTASDPAALRFEAVATSGLWRFRDDVVVRVRPEGAGARLDVRSKSRVGRSDFGANAARIRAFTAKL